MRLFYTLSLFIGVFFVPAFPQNQTGANFQDEYQLRARRLAEKVTLDGKLEEAVWTSAELATDFWEKWPQDQNKAKPQTEVRVAYDDKFLYFGITCYEESEKHIIQTLKRDTRYWESDGIAIVLDPVNQRSNGFFFGLSPYNVQAEDLLTPGAFGEMTFSWDNRWFSATKLYKDRWTAEIAIPFKTLRYEAGKKTWGLNFIRSHQKTGFYHTWTHVPVQFNGTDLGYTGALIWDAEPPLAKGNVSLIPYITGSVVENKEAAEAAEAEFDAGLDAKIAVTPSLNLDLTVNPDFSQIEVDRQVSNLSRFNIFFPERRTFFLENSDIFSDIGTPPARPFFSRRIGLDAAGSPIPILAGARLSGNLDKNWRMGLMNMQTREAATAEAQNYSAVAFNRRVFARSLAKVYATHRQATSGEGEDYASNAGGEFVFSTQQGDVTAWAGMHGSWKPGFETKNYFRNLGGTYSGRNINAFIDYIGIGDGYTADLGFIQRIENYDQERDTVIRLGYNHVFSQFEYIIRPKNPKINAHNIGTEYITVFNPDGSLNERTNTLYYNVELRNTSEFEVRLDHQEVRLLFPFGFTEAKPLPIGRYVFRQFNIEYASDVRKALAFAGEFRMGEFYNGTLRQYVGELIYRRQPWGNFSLNMERNELDFPAEYGSETLTLVGSRLEINFSNSLWWTTFLQYNTQQNNFNVNSRLQWRFKPMSDFFLVYTDNSFSEPFLKNKNRALVFKLNYWITM